MMPRRVRQLLESALDEVSWIWSRRISLLIDEALAREVA
jgi:hypothetical protein